MDKEDEAVIIPYDLIQMDEPVKHGGDESGSEKLRGFDLHALESKLRSELEVCDGLNVAYNPEAFLHENAGTPNAVHGLILKLDAETGKRRRFKDGEGYFLENCGNGVIY